MYTKKLAKSSNLFVWVYLSEKSKRLSILPLFVVNDQYNWVFCHHDKYSILLSLLLQWLVLYTTKFAASTVGLVLYTTEFAAYTVVSALYY